MRIVFFILLGVVIVVFYLLVGIKFKVLALIKSDSKSAYYTLNHRFLNLIQGKVLVLDGGELSVINKKNILFSKKTEKGFAKYIALEMLENIKLTRVDVFIDTGLVKDAFLSAIVSGGSVSIGGIIKGIMENKQIKTNIHYSNNLNRQDFAIAVDLNIKITTLRIILSIIKAKIKFRKSKVKEKKYA